jgi:hypothetical protein
MSETTTPPSAKRENTQDQPGVEMLPGTNNPLKQKEKKTTPDSCELLPKPTG